MLICNCRIARKKYIERVGKLQNVCVCVCVCMYIYIYICMLSFQNASTQFPAVVSPGTK